MSRQVTACCLLGFAFLRWFVCAGSPRTTRCGPGTLRSRKEAGPVPHRYRTVHSHGRFCHFRPGQFRTEDWEGRDTRQVSYPTSGLPARKYSYTPHTPRSLEPLSLFQKEAPLGLGTHSSLRALDSYWTVKTTVSSEEPLGCLLQSLIPALQRIYATSSAYNPRQTALAESAFLTLWSTLGRWHGDLFLGTRWPGLQEE